MNFGVAWSYKTLLLHGFLTTIQLSLLGIFTGLIVGVIVGVILTSHLRVVKAIFIVYVQIFRGSPLLLQLFMVYFALPYIGVMISAFQSIWIVLTLNAGAFIAEIVRSGIEAVPNGQTEAAECIGMTHLQLMSRIILPQTLKVSLPPLVGFFIGMIKDTSLTSIIGYVELVKQGQGIINVTDKPFEVYIVISLLYFIICYPLSLFVRWIERRQVIL
jgi:polar amino acid transport system permease protein